MHMYKTQPQKRATSINKLQSNYGINDNGRQVQLTHTHVGISQQRKDVLYTNKHMPHTIQH